MTKTGYVYIMSSQSQVLYVGVTGDIEKRVLEHKNKVNKNSFTARYNVSFLVWYDSFPDITQAIAYEKKIKKWARQKKVDLIEKSNPKWLDLSNGWYRTPPAETLQHTPSFRPERSEGRSNTKRLIEVSEVRDGRRDEE